MPAMIVITFVTTFLSLLGMVLSEKVVERIPLIGSYVGLSKTYNDGVAFGLDIPDPWQGVLIVSALLLVMLAAYMEAGSENRSLAYGLIIGGAWANLIDRLIDGHVTDIMQLGTFPTFNVADAAISIGVAILVFDIIFDR